MRALPLLALLLTSAAACSSDPPPPTTDAAVDAPATDVPVTDVPVADASVTDVPATDVPVTDVPVTDAPATDAGAGDAGCARPDVVVLTERVDCGRNGTTCPAGYTCMDFSGIVLQQYCGRACETDCDCPATQRCGSYTDKAGTHPLCVAM